MAMDFREEISTEMMKGNSFAINAGKKATNKLTAKKGESQSPNSKSYK